jgi:hypothetical protein
MTSPACRPIAQLQDWQSAQDCQSLTSAFAQIDASSRWQRPANKLAFCRIWGYNRPILVRLGPAACPGKVVNVRDSVRSWKLYASVAVLLILTSRAVPIASSIQLSAGCVIDGSGDLIDEIRSMASLLPGPESDGMVVPTVAQMGAWEHLLDATEEGDLATACGVIATHGFPYDIVRYTDTAYDGRTYFLLREDTPISVGWGTYVINVDNLRDVVIEVPHPGCEWHTEQEGIELFRQVDGRAFLMAGTDRCANITYSPCSGTTTFCGQDEPHRTSDVAHATQTMFHASHRALVEPGDGTVAVQIHGCADPDCPDLFISNATCEPGALGQRFYSKAQIACEGFSVDLADCVPPECSFVGTTNVQGRFSNGSVWLPDFEPCGEFAPGPSEPEQFLHLEQSRALRQDFACLAVALRMTFSETHRRYLPLTSSENAVRDTRRRSGCERRYPQ